MATQADLFLAILALDAYNRGYNRGMTFNGNFNGNSDSTGTQIGDATIQAISADPTTSFYAIAYSWEGETVISYRGTTFPGAPDLGDVLNGWTLSIGYAQAAQAQMALDFYTQVRSQIAGAADSQVIQLTGHSLGTPYPEPRSQ